MIDQRDGFTRPTKVHRQLGANQTTADNHYALRVAKPRFAGLVLLLAVQRNHQLAAFNRRHKSGGARGQHQFVVLPGMIFRFHDVRRGVDIGDPGIGEQAQVVLFRELPRRLAGEIFGTLILANDVA